MHKDRCDQSQQEQGRAVTECPRHEKPDGSDDLDRSDDASMEIRGAEMEQGVDAAPKQGQTEDQVKGYEC
jgi:hypothetical protein